MSTPNAAIIARLKAAKLLQVAERVAAREEMPLRMLIDTGCEPTTAHVALWRTLAAEGQTYEKIAAIVAWPPQEVARQLLGITPPRAARPAPQVDVAAAVEGATKPLLAELALVRQEAPAAAAAAARAATAPIKEKVQHLAGLVAEQRRATVAALVKSATTPLRSQIAALRKTAAKGAVASFDGHLSQYGKLGVLVRVRCAEAGVPLAHLLSGVRQAPVVRCRAALIRELSAAPHNWSTPAIGQLLCLDHTSVGHHLRKQKAAA